MARHGRREGGTTRFTYQGADVLLDENDGVETKYLNGLGIDNKLRQTTGTDVNYFLTDHLGSTNALTDANGNLTSQASYDSFGNQTGDLATRYGFTGREKDDFTGLLYYRARWYDPKIGRFISEDPIGLAGGINQYSYVGNNPTNGIDPFGLYEIDVHYYLTKYLAQSSGCFGKDQARDIAEGNQTTDEDNDKLPGKGRTLENSMYHALHTGAAPGFGSRHLWWRVRTSGYNLERLGNALHYFQDTFSHEGYPHPNWGHATGMHGVDKTATDVEKTIRMAKSTYALLGRFAGEACRCDINPWSSSMEDVIRRFAGVATDSPYAADIEGDTGVIGKRDWLADPSALRRKVEILRVDWR